MEQFSCCPICSEVPEREIFQCVEGHIICGTCISRLGDNRCPQCRIPLGDILIRTSILEEMLDTQRFPCTFKTIGCTYLCQRQEISSHENSCNVFLQSIPICAQLRLSHSCDFRIGYVSRSQIISHFSFHKMCVQYLYDLSVDISGGWFQYVLHKKAEVIRLGKSIMVSPILFTSDNSETSPLFLLYLLIDFRNDFLSAIGIQLWGTTPSVKCNVEFCFHKEIPSSNPETSSNKSSTGSLNAFPLKWTSKVSNIEDAEYHHKLNPIRVSLKLLEDSQFGAIQGDGLHIKFVLCS